MAEEKKSWGDKRHREVYVNVRVQDIQAQLN